MRFFGKGSAVAILAVVLAAVAVVALVEYSGEGDGGGDGVPTDPTTDTLIVPTGATVTLDEVGCIYEGDATPPAPAFMLETSNLTSDWAVVEVNRIPANVPDDAVDEFFEDAETTVSNGGEFEGVPADWSLIRRGGGPTGMAGLLVGDPQFPDQALVAGQRYVVWCSLSETPTVQLTRPPPKAVFLATIFEASG